MMAPTLARRILLQRAAALYDDGRHAVATDLLRDLAVDSEQYSRPLPPRPNRVYVPDWNILPRSARAAASTI
jgi:hypothetical protein